MAERFPFDTGPSRHYPRFRVDQETLETLGEPRLDLEAIADLYGSQFRIAEPQTTTVELIRIGEFLPGIRGYHKPFTRTIRIDAVYIAGRHPQNAPEQTFTTFLHETQHLSDSFNRRLFVVGNCMGTLVSYLVGLAVKDFPSTYYNNYDPAEIRARRTARRPDLHAAYASALSFSGLSGMIAEVPERIGQTA